MTTPSYHLVVARYKEDVSWTTQFEPSNVFIYDKSDAPLKNTIPRANIGREVESFLFHIIKHYTTLPDYLIFLQGKPFDHLKNATPSSFRDELLNLIVSCPIDTKPLLTNLHMEQVDYYKNLLVPDYYTLIFNEPCPTALGFAAGCQYIVPKHQILSKSLQFYKKLHAMTLHTYILTSDQAHQRPNRFEVFSICGWTLERLLYSIFMKSSYNPTFNIKRYLITGGAGFIGSNLIDELKESCELVILDNLSTGKLENIKFNPNVMLVKGDIHDKQLTQRVGFVDGIFHMAAMSKVLPSLQDPSMVTFCTQQNVLGTINILQYALEHTPPVKVVYSASSTYYGNTPTPHVETQLPDCQTPYALTKYIGELYCNLYSRLYNVPTVRLRYFMVFGPNEPDTGAYAVVSGIFMKRKEKNEPLLIHGDGQQSRDFVHVKDICKANILAMTTPTLVDDTINVGTGTSLSIKELANLISDNQLHTEKRKVDLNATLADTTKLSSTLKWVPNRTIQEYIASQLSKGS